MGGEEGIGGGDECQADGRGKVSGCHTVGVLPPPGFVDMMTRTGICFRCLARSSTVADGRSASARMGAAADYPAGIAVIFCVGVQEV